MLRSTASLAILMMLTLPVRAGEEAILARDVEVRAGPSPRFPPTGRLQAGDRVDVLGAEGEFLRITPPEGDFSLVPREAVKLQGETGIIVQDDTESQAAGTDGKATQVRGARLPRGALVTIVGEALDSDFYRIRPHVSESRYIPASAVRKQELVRAGGDGLELVESGDPVEAMVQQADVAYRSAESTGDWESPKKLYEELARCPRHDARMLAWNRLEFIRTKSRSPSNVQTPIAPASAVTRTPGSLTSAPVRATERSPRAPGGWRDDRVPGRPGPAAAIQRPEPVHDATAPRAGSSYTYATDQGPGRKAWGPVGVPAAPAAPASRIAESTDVSRTGVGSSATLTGRLHRARQTADGKPLYYLEGSQGELRCYATAAAGLNLDAFLERVVELRGTSYVYRGDLRGWHLSAVQITPLQ